MGAFDTLKSIIIEFLSILCPMIPIMSTYGIPGLWTQVLDTVLWTLDTALWTLVSGCWTLNAGLWTLDPGCWTLNLGLWTLDAGRALLTLSSGHWTLLLAGSEQN